jgi:type II secretion system protein G
VTNNVNLRDRRGWTIPDLVLMHWFSVQDATGPILAAPFIVILTTKQEDTSQMMRINRNQKGFTLIELLIVVAIIGILAAIAIPNLLTAMQRSKQKRTMADMRSIATAWEAYATDNNAYNAAGQSTSSDLNWGSFATFTYGSLSALISPTYIRNTPENDGWNFPYQFAIDTNAAQRAQEYAIRSLGKDRVPEGALYSPGPTNVFECDIVYSMGAFVAYPEGIQTASSTN